MVAKALQSLWKDRLTIIEYDEIVKPNGSIGFTETIVYTDLPCKLSFSTLREVTQTDSNSVIVQVVKLFLDNRVIIKPGSKLIVLRNGRSFIYAQSGEPGFFTHHQEIVIVPFKGWA